MPEVSPFGTLDEVEPGTPTACRVLYFPDTAEIKMILNRVLSWPGFLSSWITKGDLTGEQSAAIFKEIWLSIEDRCMIGAIYPHVLEELPGWALPCDGSVFQRADYPRLYDVISTALIIDSEQFMTPDLRGRVPVGETPAHSSISERVIGQSGGAENHTLDITQIPAHTHFYVPPVATVDLEAPGVPNPIAAAPGFPVETTAAGSGLSHNNMQPFTVVGFYIVAR